MDPALLIVKSDVTVEKIEEICHECEGRPATHVVLVDFRSAGMQEAIGSYCRACAKKIASRIQDGLPA